MSNPFKKDSFADMWAKTDYLKQLVVTGQMNNTIDQVTEANVQAIIGDLYQQMEKSFGDKRLKSVIAFAFKEPGRILS